MNLLIIDDEIITVQGILKGVHWEELKFSHVYSCTSAEDAKELFGKHDIDIILSDIEMQGESGIRLLEWVRDKEYDTECIFLTCHDEFNYAQKALKLNGMDYLLKPVPYSELQQILKKAIKKVEKKKLSSRYQEFAMVQLNQFKDTIGQRERNSKVIVEEVKSYINSHLQEELSSDFLAKRVFVSAAYLFHVFKKEENKTLVEYITEARMFYAAELLKEPNISVSRVAISVGYNNYCYFTKVFKKVYGVTPSQYQRSKMKQT